MAICRQCEHFAECSFEAACSHAVFDPDYDAEKCAGYKQIKMTNADRIRSMSDEKLASFLVSVESRRRGDGCGAIWGLPYVALEWLKQPAEVE